MSLSSAPMGPIPAETMRIARAAFPKGTLAMRLRDMMGTLYDDPTFADLFSHRGRPAEAPWRLALVTVLQFAEGLSDRQAADAVRGHLGWKYAFGLEVTDAGFDHTLLGDFRARLGEAHAEYRLLSAFLEQAQRQGLLKGRGRQRTDATHVLAAIRGVNRLVCVGETLRQALNVVAADAPDWLRARVQPDWFDRYSRRFEESRVPANATERTTLAGVIGADGHALLTALRGPDAPASLRALPAVDTLRRVWVQQYYAPTSDGAMRWRDAADLPPAALLIVSPYDAEARSATKRTTTWVGYKVHVTETCDDGDAPQLMTHVDTTPATTPDHQVTERIHADLAADGLLPRAHLLDAAYRDAELLLSSRDIHGVELCGPVGPDPSWQARAQEGFAAACFAIDWEACHVTCPPGKVSHLWVPGRERHGQPVIRVTFHPRDCAACPCRAQCTRAARGPRKLGLRPREQHAMLQATRRHQQTAAFKAQYAARAGVEGTLSQGVRVCDLRQARYRGLAKTHLQHVATATAINLYRLDDWWTQTPRERTRQSAFAALAACIPSPAFTNSIMTLALPHSR